MTASSVGSSSLSFCDAWLLAGTSPNSRFCSVGDSALMEFDRRPRSLNHDSRTRQIRIRVNKCVELIVEAALPCLSGQALASQLDHMLEDEADKLRSVVCARAATNSLHGLLMMQEIAKRAAREAGDDEGAARIVRDARGKPHIKIPSGSPPHLSLSHSSAYLVLAVGRHSPIGVDIEEKRMLRAGLLEACCLPNERAWIEESVSEPMQQFRFSLLWTLKESFMKAVGAGLAIDPFEIEFEFSEVPRLIASPHGTNWRFLSYVFCEKCVISLCLPGDTQVALQRAD